MLTCTMGSQQSLWLMAHTSSNKSALGVSKTHREREGANCLFRDQPGRLWSQALKAGSRPCQQKYKTMSAKVQEHEDSKGKKDENSSMGITEGKYCQ